MTQLRILFTNYRRAIEMAARPTKATTQNLKDRILTEMRLKDFDPEHCPAATLLTRLFGTTINATDLVRLAETCAFCLDIYLDREARRRKSVLLKWFDENLQAIGPFLSEHIVVENKSQELLGSGQAVERLQGQLLQRRPSAPRGD